ncbi:ESSS subunit of NADH:ubiquinone oxidoreductase-domain-containing protein [Pseudomassariella vexata]|uniref:NADH dehydrogenase [ubiquinone] 1 beta subcomplex subunit 11, mitochondrial n=1 Tax=Pseudomassariella vexata TaxID=1141098 RepID=A0A1Y2DU08_9PEZI|nr:ESSS subunit of NADH:ubiquinone oxidoreductase-domain-containing protein [Pseudomassariella vexata]ORY62644.1 ESSS subunit of NADH:ubiquinone oxidoreductase-domain-containing protein [Pseudomassariella vexata]
MPSVRPQTAVRASRAITHSTTATGTMTRCFSATTARPSSHGPQYDPPSGWLFGVKPGEKYQKEGWETPLYWGFFGSFIVAAVAYGFKPDTSIQTWALEEARRRLEAEGILEDPEKKA